MRPTRSGAPILSAVDQVCRTLRERIIGGRYGAGVQLRQNEIATDLGVSHIPVREALGRLVHEGLVELIPNRGAFVATVGLDDMRDVWSVRRRLEIMAVEVSVPACTAAQLDDARTIIDRADAETSPAALVELNWHFHLTLYRSGGNALLIDLLELVFRRADRYSSILWTTHDYAGRASREHVGILDAYQRQDVKVAVALMLAHVDEVERLVTQSLQSG